MLQIHKCSTLVPEISDADTTRLSLQIPGKLANCVHLQKNICLAAIMSVTLHTTLGKIKIEIFCESVPKTAEVSLQIFQHMPPSE